MSIQSRAEQTASGLRSTGSGDAAPKKTNLDTIPKLLRAIAGGTNAQASGHHVILREAANIIERQTKALRMVQGLDIHHSILAIVDAAAK